MLDARLDGDRLVVLAATSDPSSRHLAIELRFSSPAALAVHVTPQPADGVLEVAEGLVSGPDEHYFGLGARFTPLDARGREVRTRVQGQLDTIEPAGNYLPVPFFASTRGYGIQLHGIGERVEVPALGSGHRWLLGMRPRQPPG